jgi:integrase
LRAITPPPGRRSGDHTAAPPGVRITHASGHACLSKAPPPPVEYGEAVCRYLAQASLAPASRRVYLISLTGWSWALTGQPVPRGGARRRAAPPLVPLAVLDDAATAARLAAALAERAATTDTRTVNRELSALRSASGWWADQEWITTDPTAGLRNLAAPPPALPLLTDGQVAALFRTAPGLREHAFWRVLYQTAAPAEEILRLDVGDLDLRGHRTRVPPATREAGRGGWAWDEDTTALLRWLLAGRPDGPVFVTGRRAPAGTGPAHVCPVTGRARMSYRRAAEIFTRATRPLDPAGRGWTLRQLRRTSGQPKKTSASA